MRRLAVIFLFCALAFVPVAADAGGYGSIAYSSSTGRCGSSCGEPTPQAITAALRECGETDCMAKFWFTGACGALARASNGAVGHAWNTRGKAVAINAALNFCRKWGGTDCEIKCWSCSGR